MKFNILGKEWELIEVRDDESVAMSTDFPQRVIEVNLENILTDKEYRHFLLHELTHAYMAECGLWQNTMGNGKYYDSFDSEWICEFVAIHSEDIIKTCNEVLDKL